MGLRGLGTLGSWISSGPKGLSGLEVEEDGLLAQEATAGAHLVVGLCDQNYLTCLPIKFEAHMHILT